MVASIERLEAWFSCIETSDRDYAQHRISSIADGDRFGIKANGAEPRTIALSG